MPHTLLGEQCSCPILTLATQVTTLVSSKSPQKKKGKSKRAHVLVAAVERATSIFVERGELIAVENPDIKVMNKNPPITKISSKLKNTG